MSRSVSAPSSVTNTSPCWNGLMVPGSTFRYGSSFTIEILMPRVSRIAAREAAAMPLPREETTPPVTKQNLVIAYISDVYEFYRGGHRAVYRHGARRDAYAMNASEGNPVAFPLRDLLSRGQRLRLRLFFASRGRARSRRRCRGSAKGFRCPPPSATARDRDDRKAPDRRSRRTCPLF